MIEPALPISETMARRLSGDPLLLLLDVDGTIAPIAPRPEYASVPPEMRAVLEQLVRAPRVLVSILSGRSAADAYRIVGVEGVWSVGNHGMEQRDPSGDVSVHPDVLRFEPAVAEAVRRSVELAARNPGVVVEDKRWTASVHYRLAHPACPRSPTPFVRWPTHSGCGSPMARKCSNSAHRWTSTKASPRSRWQTGWVRRRAADRSSVLATTELTRTRFACFAI